jgi:hypothetical protein
VSTARFVADEFEASGLARTGVTNSGALARYLESARGHGNRGRKVDAVDFGSEKRARNAYLAVSLNRWTRRPSGA